MIFLDADSGGRELKTKLRGWEIAEDRFVELAPLFADSFTGRDFELEDILSSDFYHRAVVAAYPDRSVDPQPAGDRRKRTKYYEERFTEQHKIGFNKRRVAEAAARLWREGRGDEETAASLKKVMEAIWEAGNRN